MREKGLLGMWTSPLDRPFVRHALMLGLLVGGFCAHLIAQTPAPSPAQVVSLLDRWLSPDAVIGGALVLLYVGELRGDVKRLKMDLRAMEKRLHDDYMTKDTIRAELKVRA